MAKSKKKIEKESQVELYTIQLTKKQMQILSHYTDAMSRLITGQDFIYRQLFESAWEKRCKEETGNWMDKEWEGGWYRMREDAEALCKQIKKRFWGLESNSLYGVNYNDDADILFDMHQVIRHQLWLDNPDTDKLSYTVDAFEAMKYGSEPLITTKKVRPFDNWTGELK